ncbi:MAG: alpha/beta hydrolase [Acidimicrobiales bacterium]
MLDPADHAAGLGRVVRGEGDPIVLLPSLGRPGSDFDSLAEALGDRGWQTIVIDLHGSGRSAQVEPATDLHAMARDVADVALQVCDGPFHVLGHAFGNRVARCMAADAPETVRSLILLGCGGRVPGDDVARAALERCFEPGLSPERHSDAVSTAFFASPGAVPSEWLQGWSTAGAAGQSAASAATDVADWWIPPAPIPVLAIVGRDDRISPPENARSLVEALGLRGRLVEIADAGHALLPEQPAGVLDAVAAFLSSTAALRRSRGQRDAVR